MVSPQVASHFCCSQLWFFIIFFKNRTSTKHSLTGSLTAPSQTHAHLWPPPLLHVPITHTHVFSRHLGAEVGGREGGGLKERDGLCWGVIRVVVCVRVSVFFWGRDRGKGYRGCLCVCNGCLRFRVFVHMYVCSENRSMRPQTPRLPSQVQRDAISWYK